MVADRVIQFVCSLTLFFFFIFLNDASLHVGHFKMLVLLTSSVNRSSLTLVKMRMLHEGLRKVHVKCDIITI